MASPIIIVEDESPIRDMLRFSLEKEGYSLLEAENYYELQTLLQQVKPQLILLDWMLPGVNGLEIIKQLRSQERTKAIPIIMLTARAEENNKVMGLEEGADDYIVKPFSPRELIARIQAVLRRSSVSTHNIIETQGLRIDIEMAQVSVDNVLLKLSALEFKLLSFLLTNQNRIYSRQQLLDQVWGHSKAVTDRAVDVVVRRLRKHLSPYHKENFIETVHGLGYRWLGETC